MDQTELETFLETCISGVFQNCEGATAAAQAIIQMINQNLSERTSCKILEAKPSQSPELAIVFDNKGDRFGIALVNNQVAVYPL